MRKLWITLRYRWIGEWLCKQFGHSKGARRYTHQHRHEFFTCRRCGYRRIHSFSRNLPTRRHR